MTRRRRLGGAAVACCLLVTACGGGDGSEGSQSLEAIPLSSTSSTSSTSVSAEASVAATGTTRPSRSETTASSDPTFASANDASADPSARADSEVANPSDGDEADRATTEAPTTTVATTVPEPTTPVTAAESTTTPPSTASTVAPPSVAPATVPVARVIDGQTWSPFARFEDVVLLQPSIRIELIGFHESNHDGARQLEPEPSALGTMVLASRNRGTGSRTAADIVVEPGTEVRAPVSGTVLRAGGYILYCRHNDDFVVIEPDDHPGWEVKILHISGVTVKAGDRVEAGVTVLAPAATELPFDSQVDEFTAEPSWPHVHIELVDPSIPDRPSTGGGC